MWKTVGFISVDSGRCWIGDPCYILHTKVLPESIGDSWETLCKNLYRGTDDRIAIFEHNNDAEGLGICVSTGGDGFYPIKAKRDKNNNVKEIKVEFY